MGNWPLTDWLDRPVEKSDWLVCNVANRRFLLSLNALSFFSDFSSSIPGCASAQTDAAPRCETRTSERGPRDTGAASSES